MFVAGYPSASAVIGRTLNNAYHEVWAAVPAGATGPFAVNTTGTAPGQLLIDPIMIQSLGNPDACVLEITDAQGSERFPITGPATGHSRLIVNNAMARTRYQFISLGRFGNEHAWLTIRAGSKQIDVILNWNTGVPGSGDVLFNHAKIICPAGVRWVPQAGGRDPGRRAAPALHQQADRDRGRRRAAALGHGQRRHPGLAVLDGDRGVDAVILS